MKGKLHMVIPFAVMFVLSRVLSAPITQTYNTVRHLSNECNNNVITWRLNASILHLVSWLITFVTLNPAKFSQ